MEKYKDSSQPSEFRREEMEKGRKEDSKFSFW